MPKSVLLVVLTLILVAASAQSSSAQDTIIELTNADRIQSVPGAIATGSQLTKGNLAEQTQITPRTEFNPPNSNPFIERILINV